MPRFAYIAVFWTNNPDDKICFGHYVFEALDETQAYDLGDPVQVYQQDPTLEGLSFINDYVVNLDEPNPSPATISPKENPPAPKPAKNSPFLKLIK